ncbi:MAG: hypothetical protein KAG28_00915 [Cocleimonas sp.]|nr:hypothetical protein [Cocleimonas sp.]
MLLNLIAELSLLFLITAIIGWLMGRYLCKSGEVEQRGLKNQFIREKELLHSQLEQRETDFSASLKQINEAEALTATQNQHIAALHGKSSSLRKEREHLMDDLQHFKQIKKQLESLAEDHQYEKEQHHRYREKTIKLTDERDELITLRNRLDDKLSTSKLLLKTKVSEMEAQKKITQQQEVQIKKTEHKTEQEIQKLTVGSEQSLQKMTAEHKSTVQQLMATKDSKIETIIKDKNEALQKLSSDKNTSSLHLKSMQEEQQYTQDENKKIKSRFKRLDEENKFIKQQLKENKKDYTLLQKKYTTLNEDSVSFEYKLKELNKNNTELRRNIEIVTIENNDYLGRLRAISSVIEVVGTEPNRIISLNQNYSG